LDVIGILVNVTVFYSRSCIQTDLSKISHTYLDVQSTQGYKPLLVIHLGVFC